MCDEDGIDECFPRAGNVGVGIASKAGGILRNILGCWKGERINDGVYGSW